MTKAFGGAEESLLARWLAYDPIPWLLSAGDPAITALVRRDLLGEQIDAQLLWELLQPRRLVRHK